MSFPAVEPSATGSSSATRPFARAPRALVVLFATATALSPGCALGPDDGTGTVVEELNANSRTAFDYFLARGLTAAQAAGIVGNLMQESNVDPTATQPGGPGRGIAQWSVGGRWDHDGGDNAVAFASSSGASVWSLNLQLDFIWFELTHFSGYGLAALRASTTVTAATIAFERDFEGCGTCVETTRISYANQAFSAYGGDAAAWGGQFVSQSFPYASAGSVSIHAGSTARISITMTNIGSHAWDSHTCIATTGPRDRASVFAGPEWTGADRPACVPSGTTVARGANHTFTWTMHAPAATGRYDEHWGMVEDGVTWFSAAGEAGPPDTDLEGIFTVTAPLPAPDAGVADAGISDAGHDGGPAGDAAVAVDVVTAQDAGDGGRADAAGDAGDGGHADAASDHVGDGGNSGVVPGGCACRAAGGAQRPTRSGAGMLLVAAVVLAGGRQRRRRAR